MKDFKSYLSSEQGKPRILILFVIFSLTFVVLGVIFVDLSYPARDPYLWVSSAMYLNKYGDFNYEFITVHTAGFVIYSAGATLITPNFQTMFFFLKFIPIFLFLITILAYYHLFSLFFKKNIEIVAALIITLSFNYFLYRSIHPVPSILVSCLFTILLSTFIEEGNLRIFIVRGLLVGGMFLTHILYAPIFLIFYFLFEIFFLIREKIMNKERKDFNFSLVFLNHIKSDIFLLMSFIIIIIPYFLNVIVNGYNFFNYYFAYIDKEEYFSSVTKINCLLKLFLPNNFVLVVKNPSQTNILYNLYNFGISFLLTKTLNWGIIFLFIGLFYRTKKFTTQKKYFVGFVNFTFILTCGAIIVASLLLITGKGPIYALAYFVIHYGGRIFELFSGLWAILVIYSVKRIIKYILSKTNNTIGINKKKVSNPKKNDRKFSQQQKKAYSIMLLIIAGSLYSNHLIVQYYFLYTNYYEDDNLTESVIFIGDYFDRNGVKDTQILLPDNPTTNFIYKLIYYENIEKSIVEIKDTSYSDLETLIINNSADYVLFNKLEAKGNCLDRINENMEVLYENSHYIFFKVI
ncbi:MAG: hypothetical protein ACTSR8_05125 [Promethearchaeota archaeon]